MQRRIAIVGAGVTGLVAARELLRQGGWSVALYERWPDVGGQASAFDVGNGVLVERYYHHLFRSDREMTALCEELLPGQLEWHRSSVGIYSGGRVWPFVSPRDLLAYRPLPVADRVRLGLAVLRLTSRTDWERMDDIPVIDWLRAASGERALRAVWMPLLLGKFGDDAPRVPLAWLWSKFVLRRQKLRGGGAGREELGYPRGSFQAICAALARDVTARGGVIHLDREVVRVTSEGNEYTLACAAPGAYRGPRGSDADQSREAKTDVVLITTPATIARSIVEWSPAFAARLEDWTYRAAVVLLLELRRPYSSTYWLNVADKAVPFLGLVEHTNLIRDGRYPAHYVYVSNYVAPDDPLARLSADELLRHYLRPLLQMNPSFREEDILRSWAFREEAAQPVPRVGNRHRLLPFETPRAGLFIANTTQIYPEDRGTNYSVRIGRDVASVIVKHAG